MSQEIEPLTPAPLLLGAKNAQLLNDLEIARKIASSVASDGHSSISHVSRTNTAIGANATLLAALQHQQKESENINPNAASRALAESRRVLEEAQKRKSPNTSGVSSPTLPSHHAPSSLVTVREPNYASPAPSKSPRANDNDKHDERKKEEEANWKRSVKRKIEEERNRLERDDQVNLNSNQELYALFNNLQCLSKEFDIYFDCPELVVVGMQSDGKSSFIEALLGFQFNIVDTNIGTRRPLVLQMTNDPTKKSPSCRFKKESFKPDEDPFEEKETSMYDLAKEIQRRTNEVAGKDKDRVSPIPIILSVQYAHCANLTIWDTPGFRLGGDKLSQEIEKMVTSIISVSTRFIVCLEQSTVEWTNTVSRRIVKKMDPNFSRTILINTKFDNRVKELRNKEQSDKYLTGEGLQGKKPYFISLPLHRDLDQQDFKEEIRRAYLTDLKHLMESHYDEKQFFNQIGFHRAKKTLEDLLTTKYKLALRPTLGVLEENCRKTEQQLTAIEKEIQNNNIEALKSKSSNYVQTFVVVIERLLHGSVFGDPERYGETLSEEKDYSGIRDWVDFKISFDIQNQNHKVYGGAQFERLMNEFEYISHAQEFPAPTINEVAAALGVSKSHNIPVFETAASDIVQYKARRVLQPLTDVVMKRCVYIMKRMFSIACEVIKAEYDEDYVILGCYAQFINELEKVYYTFVESVEADCKAKLKDDFISLTKMIDWDLMNVMTALTDVKDYDFLNCTEEDTKQRVIALMEHRLNQLPPDGERSRRVDDSTYKRVCVIAAKLFAGVRYFFVKLARNKLNAFFLDPMFQKLAIHVTNHFRLITQQRFEEMFDLGLVELKSQHSKLTLQLSELRKSRDQFKEVMMKVEQFNPRRT